MSKKEPVLNFRFVLKVVGLLCLVQTPFLLGSLGFSVYYDDGTQMAFTVTLLVFLVIGGILMLLGRNSKKYSTGRKESMVTVAISWIMISLIAMLPYYVSGYLTSIVDAFLEAVSGYTTTGVTVFADVESLPKSILFWRAITQWQGGIGIIVFLVALVPMTGESASMVFNNETTGVTHERFVPRIGVMAKWIVLLYVIFTLVGILLLWAGPLGLFDALCHTVSGISTGGFSTYNSSIADFDPYSQGVIVVLMLTGATSFTLLYLALVNKKPMELLRDVEFRAFITMVSVLSLAAILWLYFTHEGISIADSVRLGIVQLVSSATTTGYSAGDYNQWGLFFKFLMLIAMFIAGSSGSTSGGLKVIRMVILWKSTSTEFKKRVHPSAVIPVRIKGQALPFEVVSHASNYLFVYSLLIVIAAILLSTEGWNMMECIGTSVACVSNSGNLLGRLGPIGTLAPVSALNKLMLALMMILGRLEIFTFLTILQPSFWKH